jgi:hypothetical protein
MKGTGSWWKLRGNNNEEFFTRDARSLASPMGFFVP